MNFLLTFFLILPLIMALCLFSIPKANSKFLKQLSLIFSFILLLYSLVLFLPIATEFATNPMDIPLENRRGQHFLKYLQVIEPFFMGSNFLNINYVVGLDLFSIIFIVLSAFLLPISLLINWTSVKFLNKEFIVLLFCLEWLLFNVFSVRDVLVFYIFFEAILIPMFLIITVWGSRKRKVHAAYQFFLYTFFGSIFLLFACLVFYSTWGTTNLLHLYVENTLGTYTNYSLGNYSINNNIIWLFIFLGFAIKIPMLPFHIWLPEAHVEAPTSGSVLLAGILLKLGTYGLIRILMPIMNFETLYFKPFVFTLALISVLYTSFTTIRQVDLKKIIAYSSVVHMNFALLGLFSLNSTGIVGCIFSMVSHALISGALFLLIGILYDRYKTRVLRYYGGLVQLMPLFSIFFFIFTFANIGMPGTSSFVGEILSLIGMVESLNYFAAVMSSISMVLGAVFCLWLYNRVVYYKLKIQHLIYFNDLTYKEFSLLLVLFIFVLLLGIYPKHLLQWTTYFFYTFDSNLCIFNKETFRPTIYVSKNFSEWITNHLSMLKWWLSLRIQRDILYVDIQTNFERGGYKNSYIFKNHYIPVFEAYKEETIKVINQKRLAMEMLEWIEITEKEAEKKGIEMSTLIDEKIKESGYSEKNLPKLNSEGKICKTGNCGTRAAIANIERSVTGLTHQKNK